MLAAMATLPTLATAVNLASPLPPNSKKPRLRAKVSRPLLPIKARSAKLRLRTHFS